LGTTLRASWAAEALWNALAGRKIAVLPVRYAQHPKSRARYGRDRPRRPLPPCSPFGRSGLTTHLAPAVKTRIEALLKAEQQSDAADALRQEKQALRNRAEYLHDDAQRTCELEVLAVVSKDRALPAYRTVYIWWFSALVALTGEEQEREVVKMCAALETEHPEVAKKYKKNLLKLAAEATAAEKALRQADTDASHAFVAEVQARSTLVDQLRRNEGALISLFPRDKKRVRLYYRVRRPQKKLLAGVGACAGRLGCWAAR
jgi:hypothetical protein